MSVRSKRKTKSVGQEKKTTFAEAWQAMATQTVRANQTLAASFSLTEQQEDELTAAMAEIERGEYLSLEELLKSLPKHG